MSDAFDVELHDQAAIDEIRLVTELIVVASLAPDVLEQDVVDDALGLDARVSRFPTQRRPD
jgi:hypothetical protein